MVVGLGLLIGGLAPRLRHRNAESADVPTLRQLRLGEVVVVVVTTVGPAFFSRGDPWWDERVNPLLDAAGVWLLAGPVVLVGAVASGLLEQRRWARLAAYVLATGWTAWMVGLDVWAFSVREAAVTPRVVWLFGGAAAVVLLAIGWVLEDLIARARQRRRSRAREVTHSCRPRRGGWLSGQSPHMRRVAVLGGVALLLIAAWAALRPSGDQWIVAVHADNGLMYEEPCLPMGEIDDGVAVGGGEFNGLYKVADRADGEVVANCYREHGIEVEVRTMTEDDRDNWAEWKG
jgi:hypothetical protein